MNADLCDEHSRIVGTKQLIKNIQANRIASVFVAQDADESIAKSVLSLAKQQGIEIQSVPTMEQLGKMCGIAVKAAAAGLLRKDA